MSADFIGSSIFELSTQSREMRYQVLGKLKEGGFGQVHLAIDKITNRRVAIKKQSNGQEAAQGLLAYSVYQASPSPEYLSMLDYFWAEGVLHTVHELAATPLNDILHDSDVHGLPMGGGGGACFGHRERLGSHASQGHDPWRLVAG